MPDENIFGFKPGQKLLYLTELGGQPHMKIVTFVREIEVGSIGNEYIAITVQEFTGYVEQDRLYSLESIQDKFDSYTDKDARRWRAIGDGITPAAMLSNEEIDKVIDDNEEWCKAYEDQQREWSREDQKHMDDDEDDDVDKHIDGLDDLGGPSHVMGSSPTCQP